MDHSATPAGLIDPSDARRRNALALVVFVLVCAALLLRFAITAPLMDLVVDYTPDRGAFYEKIHFGTYALLALVPFALFTRPLVLTRAEADQFRALVWFTLWLCVLVVFMIGIGRSGASGYFIDTYIAAGVAGMLMFAFPAQARVVIGNVVMALIVLSALIGIAEAATRIRILPYGLDELIFRPTGLAGHPLTLGMVCAMGIGFAAAAPWRMGTRVLVALVLFVGTAAAGARLAMLVAAGAIFVLLFFQPWPGLSARAERRAKRWMLVLVLAFGAGLIALLTAGGFLARFSNGLVDENFFARITVYRVFVLTPPSDLIFGADLEGVLRIVNRQLGLPYIESTPVILVYQLGLPLALGFAGLVIWLMRRLAAGAGLAALIGMAAFFLTALSNNTLSTKTPTVAMLVVLLIAYGGSRLRRSPDAGIGI